jgi:protein gp37
VGAKSDIEWTSSTWSPVRGCTRVSPGCQACYAERLAGRFSGPGQPYDGFARGRKEDYNGGSGLPRTNGQWRWTGEVRVIPEHIAIPLHWKRPRKIFVNSMSDTFHEKLSHEEIATLFGVMAACPQHTFQVLTKRPQRMHKWFAWVKRAAIRGVTPADIIHFFAKLDLPNERSLAYASSRPVWPLPNVWLGTSVEDQPRADERIPWLVKTPAAVRFLSVEPLLGPVDLTRWLGPDINLVIVGSESGHGARRMELAWVRSIRDQCVAAGVKLFIKQFSTPAGKKLSLPVLDGRQWKEMP